MRIALLETLTREGPLTATRAAELLDDSPGNMSWHLQTLAKYGFVEEAGGGRGRSRPWRVVSATHHFETHVAGPEIAAAGMALESVWMDRSFQRLREWWGRRLSYSVKWRKAAFSSDAIAYLTADEMQRLGDDIHDLTSAYKARTNDKTLRPKGAAPVHIVAFAHPLPPSATGN